MRSAMYVQYKVYTLSTNNQIMFKKPLCHV